MHIRVPVIAQVDSVGIQHGDYLEDHMISQDLSNRVLAHQEVNHTYETQAHTRRKIDLKRKPKARLAVN